MPDSKLSSRQRQFLKGLAHHLQPVVQLGTAGLTDSVTQAIDDALTQHELIKVKIGKSCDEEPRELSPQIADATGSQLCATIGRIAILYRARPKTDENKKRIELPRN